MIGNRSLARGFAVAAFLVAVLAAGLLALRSAMRDAGPANQPNPYAYDLQAYRETPPDLVGYDEAVRLPVSLRAPAALAVLGEGRFCVGGADRLAIFEADGREAVSIAVTGAVHALAFDKTLGIVAGMTDHIEVFGDDGSPRAQWPSFGEAAYLTSVSIGTGGVYAADFGQHVVWRCDREGRVIGRIDGKAAGSQGPGFVLPSPNFDVAAGADWVWIVNPGRLRVEAFTPEGVRTAVWGRAGMEIEGFCGCCNPAHLALRPDGGFVTSEKGLPRVKAYCFEGLLEGVVAGAEEFADDATGLDVAVDAAGRVYVLEPREGVVRVYAPRRKPAAGSGP